MKILDYINNRNYKLTLEKLIIGVEEPIFINGIGTILAKADSGNSAFNVLHGEDFYKQGEVIVFTTYDEDGKRHRVSKKIQGTVDINIGAGHTESRPIVLLDVKFAGEAYINVPFTIGNRSTNKNKVLLGKEFLTKELDALIDVSSDNISNKNIEIDVPISEGIFANKPSEQGNNNFIDFRQKNNPSGTTTKVGKAIKQSWRALKGANRLITNYGRPGQNLFNAVDRLKADWEQMVADINNIQKSDKELIFDFISKNYPHSNKFLKNPQLIKIIDYLGNDYAKNNNINTQISEAVSAKTKAVSAKTTKGTETENEQLKKLKKIVDKFNNSTQVINEKDKTIIYLLVHNGSDVNSVRQILSSKYQSVKDIFEQVLSISNTENKNQLIKNVALLIIEALQQADISASIFSCVGLDKNRKVNIITGNENFEQSIENNGIDAANADKKETENSTNITSEDQPNSELATIELKYNNIDQELLKQMIRDSGHNPQLLNLYTIFSFIDKVKAYEFNSKEINIRKNVVLYYFVYSNIKPDSHKITNEFKQAEEIIKKLVPVFDISYISEAAKNYISLFNNTIKENGKLIACFGPIDDRQSVLLADKSDTNPDSKQANIVPKLLPASDSPLEAANTNPDIKQSDNARKKESDSRRREWKKVLKSLPENYTVFSKKQQNQFYNAINRITAGENNFQVPLPNNFIISKKIDNKITFISSIKNGSIKIIRRKNNNRIYEYYVTTRNNGKRYIKLNNIKKIENTVVPDVKEIKPAANNTNIEKSTNVANTTDATAEKNQKKIKNSVKNDKPVTEKSTAKKQKNGKKKKEIANVIITDKEDNIANKKQARKPGRPKGSTNKTARKKGKLDKLDKDEFKWTRGQPLAANADVRNTSLAIGSHSISKDAQDSIKKMLLDN